jgi:hypothetical protein
MAQAGVWLGMSYSKLKLAAFSLGALAVCLAASAETPGLERIGCCGGGAWAETADAAPVSEAAVGGGGQAGSYIERGATRRDWHVHIKGVGGAKFALPPAVDHALAHALAKALPAETPPTAIPARATSGDGGEPDVYEERITRWSFRTFPAVWDGPEPPPLPPEIRRCHEHKSNCHHKPPPPPPPVVPEPSTWALFILGTAAVGAALRRRRRPAQVEA